jgi:hypothetical protein
MLLKLKQEASFYPTWVQSEAEKDKYIDEYKQFGRIIQGINVK